MRRPVVWATSLLASFTATSAATEPSSLLSSSLLVPPTKATAVTARRRLAAPSSFDPHILDNCTTPARPAEGLFDVVYVVHSKDLGPLKWGMRSLVCRVPSVGKVWVVSDDAGAVHALVDELRRDLGEERVGWHDEKRFPFKMSDVASHLNCGRTCGWYFQQLLKMCAGDAIPGIRDYMVVDADLVWFGRSIQMVAGRDAASGQPTAYYYNTAAQRHKAYFDHMGRLTGGSVGRVDPAISGVSHHMIFKKDVMAALQAHCSKVHGGTPFWKAVLEAVLPKTYNAVSEYELYINYAMKFWPDTVKLRHLTFANGPRPGLVTNGGDESSMRGTWIVEAHGFEKQMAIDKKTGYDYVGYHSYAKRRYYDTPQKSILPYCALGVATRNKDMVNRCAKARAVEGVDKVLPSAPAEG